jgi:DNA-binding response OmpR family regulator
MSALLRSAGSELLTVTRAGDAFHHLPSYDPHLLMASTDALDGASLFIREIRETVRSDVPAIALTSDPSPARARSLLRAGFDLHLLRPVGGAELVRTVRDAADLRIVGAPPGRLRNFRSP